MLLCSVVAITKYSPLLFPRTFFSSTILKSEAIDETIIEAKKNYLRQLEKSLDGKKGDGTCIPPEWYSTTFTRSQGAGGQHVNKTNSQAIIRLDLEKVKAKDVVDYHAKKGFMPKIPTSICNIIWQVNKTYRIKEGALLIRSSDSRNSHDNLRNALDKIYYLIIETIKADIPGETSPEKAESVRKLIQKTKRKERLSRQKSSELKANRKVGKNIW